MNEQIKEYLAKKAAEKATEESERRADILIREGLFTKEELPERPDPYAKYCETVLNRDSNGNVTSYQYFKKVPLPVSEEEWEQISQYAKTSADSEEQERNGVASMLKGLAIVIYIMAFFLGIVLGKNLYGDFSFGLALVYWVVGLFSGTMLLGFSEVIRLLHEINQKTK